MYPTDIVDYQFMLSSFFKETDFNVALTILYDVHACAVDLQMGKLKAFKPNMLFFLLLYTMHK